MTPQQETYIQDQIEKLAKELLSLDKEVVSTVKFVNDNGGFGHQGNPTTVPDNFVNAYNALVTFANLLNNDPVSQGVYRQVLNQTMVSPQ
jgi:hypothetical protein